MPVGKLLKEFRRGKNIIRWSGEERHSKTNDLEHMCFVTMIGTCLARWEESKFNKTIDWRLLTHCHIFHDSAEVFTGDILSGTKKMTEEMKNAVSGVEQKIWDKQISPLVPKSWREEFEVYLLNPKSCGIEGQILKAADNLDALFECADELNWGNKRFISKLEEVCETLMTIDLDSLRYFLKYALPDLNIPQIYFTTKFKKYIDSIEFDYLDV